MTENVTDLYARGDFTCDTYISREKWLEGRQHTIGGSDISALVGLNPYKTNRDLWFEKVMGERVDVHNDAIQHGIDMEPVLRDWARVSYKERYSLAYRPNVVLRSNTIDFGAYSPDGLLYDKGLDKLGVWECKTALIQNSSQLEEWRNAIPEHYYLQTLWGLIVTGYDFVILTAELRFAWKKDVEIRTYHYTREEAQEDINWLIDRAEKEYDKYYRSKKEPNTILTL